MLTLFAALTDYFQLPTAPYLRSYHLRILDLTLDKWLWVPTLLEDPPFPHVREVKFDVWLWREQQMKIAHWGRVEAALNGQVYAGLESVTFVQRGHIDSSSPLDFEGSRAALNRRFPRLSAKGILKVVDGKEVCE